MVEYLFERGADADLHTMNDNGATPLHCASSNGHLGVVEFLFERGADADLHTKDSAG